MSFLNDVLNIFIKYYPQLLTCLLYTSDAADE